MQCIVLRRKERRELSRHRIQTVFETTKGKGQQSVLRVYRQAIRAINHSEVVTIDWQERN